MAAPAPVALTESDVLTVSRLVVLEVFRKVNAGELGLPITATVLAGEKVLLHLIFPRLDGSVEIGELHPLVPIGGPAHYPLTVTLEDGERVVGYSLGPPAAIVH